VSKNTKLIITNIHNEQDKQFLINSINNYNQSIAPTTFFPHLEELNLVLKDDMNN